MRPIKFKPVRHRSHIGQTSLSTTCTSCRERHLKCSGRPGPCTRCSTGGTSCDFVPSRRGKRQELQHLSVIIPVSEHGEASTCVACREKHLKCSGGPTCRRCAERGISCHFRPSHQGKRKSQLSSQTETGLGSSKALPSISSIVGKFDDKKSLRSYQFFREKTSHDLCGLHDKTFWTDIVLQASHSQPAVKHIVTALGSLHEALEISYSTWSEDKATPLHILSLKQYNEAIEKLQTDGGSLTIEAILVSCILCVCFETLQHDHVSALAMLESGIKILTEWCNTPNAAQDPLQHELVQAFSRMNMQASTYAQVQAAAVMPKPHPTGTTVPTPMLVPQVDASFFFTDPQQQHAALDSATAECHSNSITNSSMNNVDFPLNWKLRASYQKIADMWYTKLNNLIGQRQRYSFHFQRQALSLGIQYNVAKIVMSSAPPDSKMRLESELRFDDYAMEFENIISYAEDYLELGLASMAEPGAVFRTKVCCDPTRWGIIPSLLFCALRYRCHKSRHKAMRLLSSRKWREGSWNSAAAVKVAARVIDFEEQGCPSQITAWKTVPSIYRIRVVKIEVLAAEFCSKDQTRASGPKPIPDCSPDEDLNARLYARFDPSFTEESVRVVLHYVTTPWDVMSPVKKMWLDPSSVEPLP